MDESMETFVPLTFRRRGVQRVAAYERSVHDVTLLDGVARALYWQHLLDTGAMQSGSAIARAEKLHHSVVNELLHSSPVPVVVAPRGTRHSDVERVREVTCAIGERQGADLLLRTAVRFSTAAGTPLRLVSLVALDPTYGSLRGDAEAVRERALEHAQHTLETAKEALPEGIPVTSTIVDGHSVEDAVSKLDWRDGDLIMVGSSRLSAPKRLFLGSTAAKMLRVLDVPMMVVPRDQIDSDSVP